MKIAVLGYGTIGSGVVEVIRVNHDAIAEKAGEEISVKYVLDLREFPDDPVQEILVHDFQIIANDPEVETVVETMGGVKPAYEFVKTCLLNGKNVCTSNKELVAKHGVELLQIAREKKINFFFEASVGGGIPIIRPLNQCLTADVIIEISGILNGTTNYILTRMDNDHMSFEDALAEAQAKGYAERKPEADVEGYDAGRKIAILTSLAYGKQVDFEDLYMEGITKISAGDFEYAKVLGAKIKLLGMSRLTENGVCAMVAPRLVKPENPLHSVSGVFNAIFVKGNMLGDSMFYGSGAGKLPTASAVVADVVETLKNRGRNINIIWSGDKLTLTDRLETLNAFFVRVPLAEKDKVRSLFGDVTPVYAEAVPDEYAFITKVMPEKEFEDAAAGIKIISRIRTAF